MSLSFYMKGKTETSEEYVDKLPKDWTEEDLKAHFGVVVWCDYFGCKYNVIHENIQRQMVKVMNSFLTKLPVFF